MRDRWTQIETEVKDVNDRKPAAQSKSTRCEAWTDISCPCLRLITETEISRLQRSMSEAKATRILCTCFFEKTTKTTKKGPWDSSPKTEKTPCQTHCKSVAQACISPFVVMVFITPRPWFNVSKEPLLSARRRFD